MTSFIEYDEIKRIVKAINLDDFSVEDLEEYIHNLKIEIKRADTEIEKRKISQKEAQKFFR